MACGGLGFWVLGSFVFFFFFFWGGGCFWVSGGLLRVLGFGGHFVGKEFVRFHGVEGDKNIPVWLPLKVTSTVSNSWLFGAQYLVI